MAASPPASTISPPLLWLPACRAILIALAVYDLFAVLCPGGPLRLLVEESQDRNEAIPALVYGTTMSEEERRYRQGQYMAVEGRQQERLADQQAQEASGGSEYSSEYETESSGEWTEGTVTDQSEPEQGSGAQQQTEEAAAATGDALTTQSAVEESVEVQADLADHPYLGDRKAGGASESAEVDVEAVADAATTTQQQRSPEPHAAAAAATAVERDERRPSRESTTSLLPDGEDLSHQVVPAVPPGNLQQPPSNPDEYLDDDEGALKLGLGDFVFYSVLVAKGTKYGVATAAASFVAILMVRSPPGLELAQRGAACLCATNQAVPLVLLGSLQGLCMTLMALGAFQKALPALPFSIALGALFVLTTHFLVTPLVISLGTEHMVMI